jgi:hypothetical protein
LDKVIERLKKLKETRAASNDSAACTSNIIEVKVREVSKAVLPLDDANVNSNVLEAREDSETATVNATNDVLGEANVQVDKGSDAFIEDEQNGVEREEKLLGLNKEVLEEANVHVDKGSDAFNKEEHNGIELKEKLSELTNNVLGEVNVQIDYGSDAFVEDKQNGIELEEILSEVTNDVLDEANVQVDNGSDAFIDNEQKGVDFQVKQSELTNNVLGEGNVQVDRGSDAFIVNEQYGVGLEEKLLELNTRMKTVTKTKGHFMIPLHESETETMRTISFGGKPNCKKSSAVKRLLGLLEVSTPKMGKKGDVSEAKNEMEGMSNCSMAVSDCLRLYASVRLVCMKDTS